MRTTEEVAAQLVEALRVDANVTPAPDPGVPTNAGRARWGDQHDAAARAALRITLESADPLAGPLGGVILALADLIAAFTPSDPELLIDAVPARISTIAEGVRIGVLTPVTDLDDFLRGLLDRVPARPRYRAEPLRVKATLDAKLGVQQLAEYLGLTPREAAELYRERLTPAQVERILGSLVARMRARAPLLGELLAGVHAVDPEALGALPFVSIMIAVLRGVRPPGRRAAFDLVQMVELPNGIEVALVFVPAVIRRDPLQRRELAAYLRHVADRRVAPWMQWRDRRTRREALTLYVRRRAGLRPDLRHVATTLRARRLASYAGEPHDVTLRRISRISATLRGAALSRSARRGRSAGRPARQRR